MAKRKNKGFAPMPDDSIFKLERLERKLLSWGKGQYYIVKFIAKKWTTLFPEEPENVSKINYRARSVAKNRVRLWVEELPQFGSHRAIDLLRNVSEYFRNGGDANWRKHGYESR